MVCGAVMDMYSQVGRGSLAFHKHAKTREREGGISQHNTQDRQVEKSCECERECVKVALCRNCTSVLGLGLAVLP